MSLNRDIQIMVDDIGSVLDQAGVPTKDRNNREMNTFARVTMVLQFNANLQQGLNDANAGLGLLGEILEKHGLNREEELAILLEDKKAAEAAKAEKPAE